MYSTYFNIQEEKPAYTQLLNQKESGKEFSIHDLNNTLLSKLWLDEMVSDAEIGRIFGMCAMEVTLLRALYNISTKMYLQNTFLNVRGMYAGA